MDRVLIVTGGGRGIGAACAWLGAEHGYRVCVNYARNRDAAILAPLGGEKVIAQVAAATPLGRVGKAREIAQAVLWLLSDEASYGHGATYDVSGGR